MKTRFLSLILALTLLLPCLIACDSGETHSPTGGGTTSAKPTQSSAQNADSGEIPMTETDGELDYSWFEFPSPTKELCIYITENLRVLTAGAERFEAQYPDVNVNISFLDEDQFRELIRAEIMAGKGPDLVCCESVVTFPDLYKTMTTGIFTDLNPYLMNDPDFHKEDFFEEVLEAGMLGSSLFVVPIECKVPILMTSEEALRDEGISSDDLLTYEGFTEACIRYHENHPDNNLMTMGSTDYYLSQFFDTSAIGFIDYGNQTVSVDEDALHKLIDVCRAYYRKTPNDQPSWRTFSDMMAGYGQYMGIVWRDFLFVNQFDKPLQLANNMALLRDEGETPLLTIAPDRYDGVTASVTCVAAIPSASPNQMNAYRLMTILLTDEIQTGQDIDARGWYSSYLSVGIPVRRESVRNICDRDAERYGMDEIREIANLYDRINRGSIRPAILQKYIIQDVFPYTRGEKPWDTCYQKFLNTLELYASE